MSNNISTQPTSAGKGLHIGLWITQGLLAVVFARAGLMKSATPIDDLARSMPWVAEVPALARFLGVAELLAAIGLILPSATRIQPKLTVAAALGLVVVMVLATAYHALRGDISHTPVTFVLGGIAGFVAWGRATKAAIRPLPGSHVPG
jgi:uncharacterized membrane protein YphA (DoxX/SURF4 family)